MDNELYVYFTTDNKSGKKTKEDWLSKHNEDLYIKIIKWSSKYSIFIGLNFLQKCYHYVNEIEYIPKCGCSKAKLFNTFKLGYNDYCGKSCEFSINSKYQNWLNSWNDNREENIQKSIDGRIESFGSYENYIKFLSKKGKDECLFHTDEFKKKRKNTLLEKYGNENYNNMDKNIETRIKNGNQLYIGTSDEYLTFTSYKKFIINRTNTLYRNNIELINPDGLKRGLAEYHIDHKFSIMEAYRNNLPPCIVTHPFNLEIIHSLKNVSKRNKCSLSLKELLLGIMNYDRKINLIHKIVIDDYKNIKDIAESILLENKLNI